MPSFSFHASQSHVPPAAARPANSAVPGGPGGRAGMPAPAWRGTVYVVCSGLLWGTGGLTGSLFGRAARLSPLAVAGYRLTVGGALIVAFLLLPGVRRGWPSGRAAWTRVAVVGVLAAMFQACYFTAVALTSVSLATLVTIGAAPVIVLCVEAGLARRAVSDTGRPGAGRASAATMCLALTGLGLLVGLPSGGFSETAALAGAALSVVTASGFAAMTLIGARPVPGLDDLTVTGLGFTAGGLVLLPLAAVITGIGFRPAPSAVGLLIALGAGPTAVAYTLYFRGLRVTPAAVGALLVLLEPLTATILATALLGERLSPSGIAGAAILGAAMAASAFRQRTRGKARGKARGNGGSG